MSVEIAATPATQLIASANRAIYPGYAKLAGDKSELVKTFLSVVSSISVAAVPVGLGVAAIADLIVPVVLGEKWVEATPLLSVLALYSVVSAIGSNANYLFYALAIPRHLTYFTLFHLAVLIPTMFFFVGASGIVGAAWAMFAASCVSLPVIIGIAGRHLPLTLGMFVSRLWRSLLAGILMYVAVRQFLSLDNSMSEVLLLVSAIGVGVTTYVISLFFVLLVSGFRELDEWRFVSNSMALVAGKLGRKTTRRRLSELGS